jgi:hypothetical protein
MEYSKGVDCRRRSAASKQEKNHHHHHQCYKAGTNCQGEVVALQVVLHQPTKEDVAAKATLRPKE